uniref:Peptidase aspartic putative domain-containing protein n=1 Tax=Panagrolaimus davidi TaxID=227884 RepID=A0A914QUN8_9BILA
MLLTKDVKIINPFTKETTEAVAIFDSGSQKTYVSNKIIEQLKLETIQKDKLQVHGFGAKATKYTASVVKLNLETNDGHAEIFANSTSSITTTVPVVYANESNNIIKTVYKTPEILIGMDYFFELVTSFEKLGENSYLVHSKVGDMVCKNTVKNETITVTSLAVEPKMCYEEDENNLQKFWNLEEMGIKDAGVTDTDTAVLEKFKQNVKFENNRYYVSWPEKDFCKLFSCSS